jgi:hypothetical protein
MFIRRFRAVIDLMLLCDSGFSLLNETDDLKAVQIIQEAKVDE